MQLVDNLLLWSYHLLDYDWTPLNQNPCWQCSVWHDFHCAVPLCTAAHCKGIAVLKLSLCLFIYTMENINLLQTTYLILGIVNAESNLCVTIHWDSALHVFGLPLHFDYVWADYAVFPRKAARGCWMSCLKSIGKDWEQINLLSWAKHYAWVSGLRFTHDNSNSLSKDLIQI